MNNKKGTTFSDSPHNISIGEAFNTLKKAIQEDPDYAWTWHCNLAMAFHDACKNATDEEYNEGASRFMKLCFDVVTDIEERIKRTPDEGGLE